MVYLLALVCSPVLSCPLRDLVTEFMKNLLLNKFMYLQTNLISISQCNFTSSHTLVTLPDFLASRLVLANVCLFFIISPRSPVICYYLLSPAFKRFSISKIHSTVQACCYCKLKESICHILHHTVICH